MGATPTLIIIDEIAQYLSRLEAAFPGLGAQQGAAFLMSLATYAEDCPHIAVVLSLASATNAFGDYNTLLRSLQDIHSFSPVEAENIVAGAQQGVRDVINRSAEAVTPVQEGDLSKIMAKRLFAFIDPAAAAEVAEAFIETYRQADTELPAGANDLALRERLIAHYPFHPTLIEYLAEDLAQVESFQGTRGLLRTLARAIRRLWENRVSIPLIQSGHLDLADNCIRSELLGKTRNSDLRSVLDSDITKSADSQVTGRTAAGELDAANPHPDGYPVTEWAGGWLFLHSLVGRAGGLQDEKFGIDIASAAYEIASPAIKLGAVRSALELIAREANYRRERNGRLYADTAPTLNNILRRIEGSVALPEALDRVEQVVRDLIKSKCFEVHPNIYGSEDLPNQGKKPQLGVLSFCIEEFDPAVFITQWGDSPRQYQNRVLLLAPSTAHPKDTPWSEQQTQQEKRVRERILALTRKALAVERLRANPEAWGVSHEQLQRDEFREQHLKIPHELRIAVEESYRFLAYPGREGGRVVLRDLGKRGSGPTAGGSSGLHLEDALLKQLTDDGELITAEKAGATEVLNVLAALFFAERPQVKAASISANFATRRHWPMQQSPRLLGDVLRQGAAKGMWCLGFLAEPNAPKPETLYHQDNPPPITAEPEGDAWFICTREHAKQLGWLESIIRDPNTVAAWLEQIAESLIETDAATLAQAIERQHDKVDPQVFAEQLDNLLRGRKLVAVGAN